MFIDVYSEFVVLVVCLSEWMRLACVIMSDFLCKSVLIFR